MANNKLKKRLEGLTKLVNREGFFYKADDREDGEEPVHAIPVDDPMIVFVSKLNAIGLSSSYLIMKYTKELPDGANAFHTTSDTYTDLTDGRYIPVQFYKI